MQILSINAVDIQGGAARAAYRIHHGLLSQNIDTKMLVQKKISDEKSIIGPSGFYNKFLSLFRPDLDSALRSIIAKKEPAYEFSINRFPLTSTLSDINKINPDLVHLHWINAGMMKLADIANIQQPIIWTLHDMWAFTGGCHNSSGCNKYIERCHSCPKLQNGHKTDLSYKILQKKLKLWKNLDVTIVTPSNWLAQHAKQSKLFKEHKVVVIHNGIDLIKFRPFDRIAARDIWNLPNSGTKLLLFGAVNAASDHNKGFDLLHEAIQKLHQNQSTQAKIEIVIYGTSEPSNPPGFGFPVHYLGKIHDDVSLSLLYSAVDVMIIPSREENLPNTIVESFACGTPVAAFNIGGIPEMIQHGKNGYLATAYDTQDLAKGIQTILDSSNQSQEMRKNARDTAKALFDIKNTTKEYLTLYREVLTKTSSK